MQETWRPVIGTDGWYEVSDFGQVRSLRTLVNGSSTVLKQIPHGGKHKQYRGVCITYPDGKVKLKLVHHLVLEAFVGPCPAGMQALHDDDVPHNNHRTNLRWGTPKQNRADADRNGSRPFRKVQVIDGVESLKCTKCGHWKPVGQYRDLSKKNRSLLGKHSRCIQCQQDDDITRKRAKRAAVKLAG